MPKKDYDKALFRFIGILTKLSDNERPTTKELADEFLVTPRTIQNDLKRLNAMHFPITKDAQKRHVFADGFSLNKTVLSKEEMIFLSLALDQFSDVDDIDKVQERIFNKLVRQQFISPYFIKYEQLEDIDIDSPLITQLERLIEDRQITKIEFHNRTATLELYKIAAFEGFWYLFAKELEDKKTKVFKLSAIRKLIPTEKYHKTSHAKIEQLLQKVHSAFFEDGNCFSVKIKVDANVAKYFKAKDFLQTQTIEQENQDGSLIVSFEVSHDEDVDNLIKSWIPHVELLEPQRFREKLQGELKEYLKRLEAK
ncbi:MAG: transcriptional regulator [Epsilonproteobacteria bacterium]|nr:transcriptional regulator [Campylobacterota bacterium]